jgi:hypothetical protein
MGKSHSEPFKLSLGTIVELRGAGQPMPVGFHFVPITVRDREVIHSEAITAHDGVSIKFQISRWITHADPTVITMDIAPLTKCGGQSLRGQRPQDRKPVTGPALLLDTVEASKHPLLSSGPGLGLAHRRDIWRVCGGANCSLGRIA